MIVYPCTSLFDCLCPQLEEGEVEIFYQHPIYPDVKCNQIGVLYYDEKEYNLIYNHNILTLRKLKRGMGNYIGSKPKLCWECYHGRQAPSLINLYDFNPYNCTKDNLYLTNDLPKKLYRERLIQRNRFVDKTIQRLEAFTARHPHLTVEEIKTQFILPTSIASAWESFRAGRRVKSKPARRSTKSHTPDRQDDYDRVKKMFFDGVHYAEIAKEMNWGSTLRVRKFVAKHGWKRENPRWKK